MLKYWKEEYELGKAQSFCGIFGRNGHGCIKDWYNGKKTIEEIQALQAGKKSPGGL